MAIKKNRVIANMERDKKIEQMDLEEVTRYLCMKNYQKPEKCNSCPGKNNCRAGQRAIFLLNEKLVDEMIENGEFAKRKGKKKAEATEQAKLKFSQALKQPDMIQYVMDKYGNTRNCARENLKHWAQIFPDLAEQNNFNERFAGLTLKSKTVLTGSALEKQMAAKERYSEALAQPDPIAFMMEKYGIDRAKAVHNFGQWKRRYGEKKEESTMETDEISIEDFLKENENAIQHTEKSAEEEKEPEKQDGGAGTQNQFFGDLNAKFNELAAEKKRLEVRLAWIEKAQDALAMTLNIFNPESAISKGLFGE